MVDASKRVLADDVTLRIDTEGHGPCGTGDVDGGEGALPEEKAMAGTPDVVDPNDVTLRVDTLGRGACGAGDVDGGEDALPE